MKEPLATPLVPPHARDSNDSSFMGTSINDNPLLIALSIIALILFVLLLLTLLLYGRSKRRLAVEAKRQSATQVLVQKIHVDDDINTIRSNSLEDVGVENLAFENDGKESVGLQKKEPPILNFPLPPVNRPSSSSSTTSDSSVYYPKRRYKFSSIQDLLDERDGKTDEIYTKLKSSTTAGKKKDSSKVHKNRHRRKYRSDNRVGSLEQINATANAFQSDNDNEEAASFNPHMSHYNTNKLMSDKTFTVIESERKRSGKNIKKPNEAINQELLQHRVSSAGIMASADSNSIGSFLSMASIRSFPK